ncbi:NUDIX domain-containing protein [Catenovulum sp. 2E275]|uniref:NUDIX hydrolase n=1 Tax=Catenovulum sp. 2E275 TaxID=2980497 RepID=UPI0021D0B432|nr:NUDIX domain-containing protein [Catenovulum sp. 2E275]MCU4675166.1 NUDIX domain-containing protein [Catenovulum sp. 2E275]
MFSFEFNTFGGVHLKLTETELDAEQFSALLIPLIEEFKQADKKIIWLTLAIEYAEYIPLCTELGFEFHNCLPNQITLIYKLQNNAYAPFVPTHTVGAGAVVINQNNQILMVRDNFGHYRGFKLPGGHVELGEDIQLAAEREVLEETGVVAKFSQVVGFVHKHPYRYGKSNLYFICQLTAVTANTSIQDANEIAEVKWLDINEFIADNTQSEFVRQVVRQVQTATGTGLKLTPSAKTTEKGIEKRDLFIV